MARFSQEEYENAKEVNLLDYLQKNGYKLKTKGREFCLEEHDSLCINPEKNTWYWYSKNIGGSVIQFLQEYEGKTLVEAIYSLNNKSTSEYRAYTKYESVEIKKEKGELILPPKNEDNRRVQAYLTKTRGLDFEIVNSLIKQDVIYESADKHEVVFLSKDKEDNVKYASKRSTLTNSSFRQDISNSNKEFGFKTIGSSNKLFVFESPIDLISHCTLSKIQGKDWKVDNRVSLGGVSDVALKKFLEENQHIEEIVLFLDNDTVGQENSNKICKKYGLDYKVSIFTSKYKDLNETLIKFKDDRKTENVKLSEYVSKINNPFIEPRLQDKEKLKNYLKKITKDIDEKTINNLFDKGILELSEDNKAILFIKDENGQNIGGYELDIFNKMYENPKLIENSYKSPVFIESIKDNSDFLMVTNNIIGAMSFSEISNIAYVNDFEDVRNIEKVILKKEFKDIILLIDKNNEVINSQTEKGQNFLKELNNLQSKYSNINISVEEEFENGDFDLLLKDDYIRKPFIESKVGDNEELYKYLNENSSIPKNKIIEMIKDNHIYQDVDRNMVFLVKNEQGQNIGGYSLDIYNSNREIKLLENSYISDKDKNEIINFANYIKNQLDKSYEVQREEIEQEL